MGAREKERRKGMHTSTSTDRLVSLIYGALLGENSWQTFLDELRLILPNGKATLFFHDALAGHGTFSLASGMDDEIIGSYNSHYSKVNPWMPGAATRKVGVAVPAEFMLSRDDLKKTEYYNDFLRPQEISSAIGATLFREEHCNFLISVATSEREEANLLEATRDLQVLVPHLRRAFDYYRRDNASALGLVSGEGLNESHGVALVSLDHRGKVRSTNAAAADLIDQADGIWVDCMGRFRCESQAVTDQIESTLSHWAAVPAGGSARSFLVRRGTSDLPLRITVLARSLEGDCAFFRGPECILLIEGRQVDQAPNISEISAFYGLTGAETRVVAGLVEGLSLAQIANRAGLSPGTLRVQMKQVFVKMGVNRQAEVVRRVYTLS